MLGLLDVSIQPMTGMFDEFYFYNIIMFQFCQYHVTILFKFKVDPVAFVSGSFFTQRDVFPDIVLDASTII